jgi:hypothetical protein
MLASRSGIEDSLFATAGLICGGEGVSSAPTLEDLALGAPNDLRAFGVFLVLEEVIVFFGTFGSGVTVGISSPESFSSLDDSPSYTPIAPKQATSEMRPIHENCCRQQLSTMHEHSDITETSN